jgi:OOP family OmpA-OmpF porin
VKKIVLNIIFLACVSQAFGQATSQNKSKFIRQIQKTVWTAGISGVVIDDDGKPFKDLFDVKDNWNLLPYPTRATLEGFIDKGISVEGSFTYMRLKQGKLLSQDVPRPNNVTLIAFDANVKYDLNEVIGDTKFFSPYVIGGLGYTSRSLPTAKSAVTGNFGLGFTFWIYRGWGLNVQSMAKFALNKASSKNYLMHTVGVVYRFNLLTGYKTPGRLGHRYNLFRNQ